MGTWIRLGLAALAIPLLLALAAAPAAAGHGGLSGGGSTDGWVDAHGDTIYGELVAESNIDVGTDSILFDTGALQGDASAGDGLRFAGERVCVANRDISGCGPAGDPWFLGGNAGTDASTDFLGTTDATRLVVKVDGTQAATFVPTTGTPNVLAGNASNAIADGVVGAVVAGGGNGGNPNQVTANYATVGGGLDNDVRVAASTVSGGRSNTAEGIDCDWLCLEGPATVGGGERNSATGAYSTVAGGRSNTASGTDATVAGGRSNTAGASEATVPGGRNNNASGLRSFAAGAGANATHAGTFVWSDTTSIADDSFRSTGQNQFLIEAAGGVGIGTNSPSAALDVDGDISVGAGTSSDDQVTFDGDTEALRWDEGAHEFRLTDALRLEIYLKSASHLLSLADTDDSTSFERFQWFFNGSTASSGDRVMTLDQDGDLRIGGTLSTNSFDLAESYRQAEPVTAGDLVRVDPGDPTAVRKADAAHPGAIGIVSTEPGLLLGGAPTTPDSLEATWGSEAHQAYQAQLPELREEALAEHPGLAERLDAEDRRTRLDAERTLQEVTLRAFSEDLLAHVALAGRVPTKVAATNGPVEPGDPLTVSGTPGVAEEADPGDPVVGKALEPLEAGTGTIEVFVSARAGGAADGTDDSAPSSRLEETVDEQAATIDALREENAEQADRIEALEEENRDLRENLTSIRNQLEQLSEDVQRLQENRAETLVRFQG